MKLYNLTIKAALIALLLLPSVVFAATQGTIGTTSTGISTVSITIPKLIIARNFADFAFTPYTGTGSLTMDDDINVAMNFATPTYKVNAVGNGAASAFTITDGSQTIAYTPYFNDATGTVGRVELTTGVDLTTQGGGADTLADTDVNANLSIDIAEAALQAVNAATYTGTITLVFTPE